MSEIRLIISLIFLLSIPGATILCITDLWSFWRGLQRMIVIFALSSAFYPILFYFLKILPFNIPLGPYKIGLGLICCVLILFVKKKKQNLQFFDFERIEYLGILIFGFTLMTRFWVAYQYPYPAWTDSVHHVMLTRLIAIHGVLPTTLDPYYPIPLAMYHLGLHTIASVVAWISQAPFHSDLLWTAQAFNGLCGLGAYFVLDRKFGKLAAITGAIVVGIFSYQPAFYVNWGRFTQVASQSVLLIGWLMTYETIKLWGLDFERKNLSRLVSLSFLCALVNAGMMLIHFRVAAFYILLLLPSVFYLIWNNHKSRSALLWTLLGTIVIGVFTLVLISPGFFDALITRIHNVTRGYPVTVSSADVEATKRGYFEAPLTAILDLAAQRWLLFLFAGCATFGLIRRNKLVILNLLWIILLCGLGNLYWLGIPFLNVVNFSGTVIMFYLPFGLVIGAAVAELFQRTLFLNKPFFANTYLVCLLCVSLPFAYQRVTQIELFRYFVTNADVEAMNWIRQNLPEDAVFAVNTDFWLPAVPYGTDAGYWIPYFTNRQTTAAAMLVSIADHAYQDKTIGLSRIVVELNHNPAAFDLLTNQGVCYIYIGVKGNYKPESRLDVDKLVESHRVKPLYMKDGVTIFRIIAHSQSKCVEAP